MVDLETWGTRAGCAVLSIGAVAFDPKTDTLGPEFYVVVDRISCARVGLFEDPDTVAWWSKQAEAAKQVLVAAENGVHVRDALNQFNEYLKQFPSRQVWGNGADFDNPILISCYAAVGAKQGWGSWNGRCYRTLKSFAPSIKLERLGTYHNALDDAKSQAAHANKIINHLGLDLG